MALVVKNLPASAGDLRDMGSIPGLGRSPGGGRGNPLQYSCLENPMDRGVWWATVHRVTKNQTRLKRQHTHTLRMPRNKFILVQFLPSACVLSCFRGVGFFVTLWTVAHQALLSMEFSRQEYWSGLPCPPPGDLPIPGIEAASLMSSTLAGRFFT